MTNITPQAVTYAIIGLVLSYLAALGDIIVLSIVHPSASPPAVVTGIVAVGGITFTLLSGIATGHTVTIQTLTKEQSSGQAH